MARPRKSSIKHPYPALEDLLIHINCNTQHSANADANKRLSEALAALFGNWEMMESNPYDQRAIPDGVFYEIGQIIRENKITEFAPAVRDYLEEKYSDIAERRNADFDNVVKFIVQKLKKERNRYIDQADEARSFSADALLSFLALKLNVFQKGNHSIHFAYAAPIKMVSDWLEKPEISAALDKFAVKPTEETKQNN